MATMGKEFLKEKVDDIFRRKMIIILVQVP